MNFKKIMVDTSVLVDLLRAGSFPFREQITDQIFSSHPYVTGEVAIGNFENRNSVTEFLLGLYRIQGEPHSKVLRFMEDHELYGKGIGYIVLHLLYSATTNSLTTLWTRYQRLQRFATQFDVAYPEDDIELNPSDQN